MRREGLASALEFNFVKAGARAGTSRGRVSLPPRLAEIGGDITPSDILLVKSYLLVNTSYECTRYVCYLCIVHPRGLNLEERGVEAYNLKY